MDPLTAIGLASNLLQFAELGVKLFLDAKRIYGTGSTDGDKILAADVGRIKDLAEGIRDEDTDFSKIGAQLQSIASKCNDIGNEILGILDRLRLDVEGRASKWKSFEQGIAHLLKNGKLKKLGGELEVQKKSLHLFLTAKCAEEQANILKLVKTLKSQNEKLKAQTVDTLEETADRFERSYNDTQREQSDRLIATIKHFQYELKALQQESLYVKRQQDVLRTLWFPHLRARQDRIDKNHEETFKWVFHSSKTTFPEWLESQGDIFWIAGKPGSGKSTLMKFLSSHQSTKSMLDFWSGGKQVIVASHYFWNAGHSMQKSRLGLLQTLLFEVLSKVPHLIEEVCKTHWSDAEHSQSIKPWTEDELDAAFTDLSEHCQTGLDLKFCFFIDGLDEQMDQDKRYKETFDDLLKTLKRLVACPSIKICASSRPWLPFEKSFASQEWKLLVEDLTTDDIKRFVDDNLVYDEAFRRIGRNDVLQMANVIVTKAQGVFLWVDLVIRALKRSLENRDKIAKLHQRLEEIPEDLEDFFDHMLDTIEPTYWGETSRIFRIMIESEQALPLVAFQFLEEEETNPGYAFTVEPLTDFNDEDLTERLKARGRDLLSITDDSEKENGSEIFLSHVDFLHRTVREFFATEKGKKAMEGLIERGRTHDFNPLLSLCRIMLGLGKAIPYRNVRPDWNRVFLFADGLMHYARRLEETCTSSSTDIVPSAENNGTLRLVFQLLDEVDRSNSQRIRTERGVHWTNYKGIPNDDFKEYRMKTFLATAIQSRLSLYVQHKLLKNPSQIKEKPGRPLLDYALRPTMITPWRLSGPDGPVLPLVKLLLEHEVNPNRRLDLYDGKSTWELFLHVCDGHNSVGESSTLMIQEMSEVMVLMVSHGADINCTIEMVGGGRGNVMDIAQNLGIWSDDLDKILDAAEEWKQAAKPSVFGWVGRLFGGS